MNVIIASTIDSYFANIAAFTPDDETRCSVRFRFSLIVSRKEYNRESAERY